MNPAAPAARGAWVDPGPPAPATVEETGHPLDFLGELAARVLFAAGAATLADLSERLGLSVSVTTDVVRFLERERLAEVKKGGALPSRLAYGLTGAGRERAGELLEACAYVGPVPVTAEQYDREVAARSVRAARIAREAVEEAFAGVVLRPGLLDRLGPALASGRSIFLYGPAGAGKTFIARRLARAVRGAVAVPHAVAARGRIVRVFDPACHRPVEAKEAGGGGDTLMQAASGGQDRRFVMCERPFVTAGGELDLAMLDLRLDPASRCYEAPLQLKANGGVLLIDDLGRQRVRPFDLLNRWIVPLERGRDYLSFGDGQRLEVPFDQIVIFATNLSPRDLADEAFLRRLGYKIRVDPLTETEYGALFRQACAAWGVAPSQEALRQLIDEEHAARRVPLCACYPFDIVGRAVEISRYEGTALRLTRDLIRRACLDYFG